MAEDWTQNEVEVIVAAYFDMLQKEQAGVRFIKSETRKKILPLLNDRSGPSIEFKNRNISAVLQRIGQPYIRGYLPAYNFQRILSDVVLSYLGKKPEVEETFKMFAQVEAEPAKVNFNDMEVAMPKREAMVREPELAFRSPVKVNYIEIEQSNSRVGRTGETIALEFEKWRLRKVGKEKFIDKVEWVSETKGDGLGFDILSRNDNGSDRYIEVKSTKLTREAPFFFSEREFAFSKQNHLNFYLYRIFDLKERPKLFIANGSYDQFCNLRPTQYKGSF